MEEPTVREKTPESERVVHKTPQAMSRRVSYTLIGLALFFAGVVAGAIGASNTAGESLVAHLPFTGDSLNATPSQTANLSDFWEVWNALQTKFVESHASSTIPTTQDKVWGAIEGLTASYGDPYTVFMPPEEAQVFQQDIAGSFGGVGIEIGVKNNVLTVISPLKGTPAAQAGVLSGDQIVAIDGQSTDGMSADQAIKLIRGPSGTTVVLTVLRNGKTQSIKIVRAIIQVPEINYGFYKNTGVYRIALYTFSANSATLFDKAFAAFKQSGSHELVIDLRGNPGGYLDAAVDIASHFLPKGEVVVTEDYAGKQPNIVHYSLGYDDIPKGTKVVVLIDQGSASAAEILSGALQDHHVATLIGTRSFGKGSVQELINVDGGALKVTVARWLTPAGHFIEDGGLTPNIEVGRTQAQVSAGQDPQMARAVQFLTTGK
ncbi:MAG: hypothetical protein B7X04_00880 [Parcubacteria group bacterium 21-54-25]|nr:MAG: hypothetical protein B7X04_00880 [Parcubacteria group bacterium 21-54-25]HQU07785.1 S41 family peptidase [Candidatus Paceibacterota bacterium]